MDCGYLIEIPLWRKHAKSPNETKMSDGGRNRASLGVGASKSSQKWSVEQSAARSIAWLGVCGGTDDIEHQVGMREHRDMAAFHLTDRGTHTL